MISLNTKNSLVFFDFLAFSRAFLSLSTFSGAFSDLSILLIAPIVLDESIILLVTPISNFFNSNDVSFSILYLEFYKMFVFQSSFSKNSYFSLPFFTIISSLSAQKDKYIYHA